MPSPRWPMRVMTSRSIMAGPDEEFAIAVAARDRRGDDAENVPAERRDACRDRIADFRMNLQVAHDPLADMLSPSFELRLDQRDEPRRPVCKRERCRQYEPQRDEAHVDDHKLRQLLKPLRRQRANIGRLERDHL